MLAFVLMLIVLLLSPVSASISSRDALKENDTREMVADQLVELMDLPPTDSALSARMNTLWSAASAFFTQSSQLFQDTFDRLESNSRLVRNVTELPLEFVSPVNLNQLPAGNESTFERVFHQWQAFGITLQAMSDSFVQQLFRSILSNQHIELNRLQPGCTLALLQSMEALKTNQLWAMRMLDSSSKFNIHGFLDGTIVDLGSYDQCLSIKHDIQFNRSQDTHHIAGQYCILKFSLPLPPKPHRLNMHTKLFSMENTSLEQTVNQNVD